MVSPQKDSDPVKRRRRVTTTEARERQLIAAAYDEAEKRIAAGKSSDSLLVHFLKLTTEREKLEKDSLRRKNELLKAQVENLASQARSEEVYADALRAMKAYSGQTEQEEYDDD